MGKVIMSGIVPQLKAPETLPAIGTALNDMTWEQIRMISDAGQAANYFSVGDAKSLTINGTVGATTFSNLSIDAFIIGIDHNSAKEGANRIHFKIGKISGTHVALIDSAYDNVKSSSGYFNMNTSNKNTGGWKSCALRTVVLGSDSNPLSPTANTLLAALPSDLRAVMKSVVKYSDNTGGGTNTASYVTDTTDYLPLLAEFEVQGSRTNANSAEQNYQEQYAYYKAGNTKVHQKHNATSTYLDAWCRSVYAGQTGNFCVTNRFGSSNYIAASYSKGVSPLFCV